MGGNEEKDKVDTFLEMQHFISENLGLYIFGVRLIWLGANVHHNFFSLRFPYGFAFTVPAAEIFCIWAK